MAKNYLNINVYEAAKKRISYIFDEFDNICVSFSGGKDSGVALNMAIDEARKRKRKIAVMFIDMEAWYQITIDFIKRMIDNNRDVLIPYWICLPMKSPNASSYYDPVWICWDKKCRDIWVREMPQESYVINEDNPPDFYKQNMPFEEFIKHCGNWIGGGKKTACILGIRTDESLNRFRAIVGNKTTYKDKKYSTLVKNETYNFYPLYDWAVPDIWAYNGKFNKDYNKLYDLFYKAGVSIYKMRVDEPFGNEEKAGLNMFRIIEPKTWGKLVNRVSGANFGNIYSGNKIMTAAYKLPKNHTWKSFTEFLLNTLPEDIANNYRKKFDKFIKYWQTVGCPVLPKYIEILEKECPSSIINTHTFSTRGKGDKEVIKFIDIPDEIKGVDTKDDVLCWKRMAMCIIKNDYICKGLSFSITKDLTAKQKELIERYKNL